MITKEELETWDQDNKQAENTHPRAFANGPFVRSLFRVSQHISGASQQIIYLTKSIDRIKGSLDTASKNIKESNLRFENIQKLGVVLTGVIAFTGVVSLFGLMNLSGGINNIIFGLVLGIVLGYFLKVKLDKKSKN